MKELFSSKGNILVSATHFFLQHFAYSSLCRHMLNLRIIYFEQILHPLLFSKADKAEVIRTMDLGYRADKRELDNQFEG